VTHSGSSQSGAKAMTIDKTTRLLRVKQLRERYGISGRTIDRWAKRGILPLPVKMSNGMRCWRETDLEELERSRMSPRSDSAA
jgi:predicted DNA-binding transcriptional regulator AlpA